MGKNEYFKGRVGHSQECFQNYSEIILSNTRAFSSCLGLSVFVQCLKLFLSSGVSHYGNNNSSSHAVYANDHILKQVTYCWERQRQKIQQG